MASDLQGLSLCIHCDRWVAARLLAILRGVEEEKEKEEEKRNIHDDTEVNYADDDENDTK